MMTLDFPAIANWLGFLALGCYIVTLLPTIMRIVFPQSKETGIPKMLLKHRRIVGVIAFIIAFFHGYLLVKQRNFDFFDPETYIVYFQGVSTFIIFTLLAITSNDWSVRRLKKNWKRLHTLTYLAMFILTWHVWDKMSGHWSYITPMGMIGISVITILYLVRLKIENSKQPPKSKPKAKLPKSKEKVSV